MPANNNRWKALILRYLLSKLLRSDGDASCLSWSQLRLFNMKSAFPMLANLESINSASPATTSFVSHGIYLIFSSQVLSAIATAILKGPSISPSFPFRGSGCIVGPSPSRITGYQQRFNLDAPPSSYPVYRYPGLLMLIPASC